MKVKLKEICTPKQWKTISTNELRDSGYPVYGANGIIGYYNEYNHEVDTLLVTCRGATCGSLNISKGKAYVNGNAMALDDLRNDIDIKYLYYYLKCRGFKDVISGSAQPQIIRSSIEEIEVEIKNKEEQESIVSKCERIERLVDKIKKMQNCLDSLIKARFVEMFGDLSINSKNWEICKLSDNVDVIGGYAFNSKNFLDKGVPVLRIGNINSGYFKPINLVYWNNDIEIDKYAIYPGDLVISLTGTVGKDDYGNICILGDDYKKYYLNQRNAKLKINKNLNQYYLLEAFKINEIKKRLTGISRGIRQANISNNDILNLTLPIPPMELQNAFATFVKNIDKLKFDVQKSLEKTQMLFDSLMQEYFG